MPKISLHDNSLRRTVQNQEKPGATAVRKFDVPSSDLWLRIRDFVDGSPAMGQTAFRGRLTN